MKIDSRRRPASKPAGAGLLLAAGVAVLSGCSGSASSPQSIPSPSVKPIATPATAVVVENHKVAVTASAPKAVSAGIVTDIAALPAPSAHRVWGFMALAPNGHLLVNVGPPAPDQSDADPVTYRSGVGLLDPQSGRLTALTKAPVRAARGPETHEGDTAGQSVVWNVGSSTDIEHLDFTLYGSWTTGSTPLKVAASAKILNNQQVSLPGGVNQPTILGDRVYWADATRPEGSRTTKSGEPVLGIDVYSRDLKDRSPRRTEADGGWLPTRDLCAEAGGSEALSYLRSAVSDPKITGRTVEVHQLVPAAEPTGKATNTVAWHGKPVRSGTATAASTCGRSVALLGSTPADPKNAASLGGSFLTLYQPDGRIDFGIPDGTSVSDVSLTARWMAFSTYNGNLDGGQFIYDRQQNKLYQLPTAAGMQAVSLRGDYVSWSIPVTPKSGPGGAQRSTRVGRLPQ